MEKPLNKKQKAKYEERAVILDGDMLPPDHPRVKEAHKSLRQMQQEYVDMTVEDFTEHIEEKMQDIQMKVMEYAQNKPEIQGKGMDAYVVNRLFFGSLTPLSSKEPKYNAEKLAIVFDFYEQVVTTINAKVCRLVPSKSNFCRFAGITTATYNGYKLSEDPDMQVVISKIDDMLVDAHLTLAQERTLDAVTTKYRMNVEMDRRENYNPQVVIKADIKDIEDYKDRINSLESMFIEGEKEE